MRRVSLIDALLLIGVVAVMATADWFDPNWRHQLSNAVIAWIAIGILSGIVFMVWVAMKQVPKLSLLFAVGVSAALFATIGAGIGGVIWLVAHRGGKVTPPSTTETIVHLAVGITAMAGNIALAYIPEIKRDGIKVEMILRNESFPDAQLDNVAGQLWVQTKHLIATIKRTPLDYPWEKDGNERAQYRIWYSVLPKMGYEWLPTLVFALPPEGDTANFGAQIVSKTTDYRQFRWSLSNKDGKPVLSGGDATPKIVK
jgi:hypothetical protein